MRVKYRVSSDRVPSVQEFQSIDYNDKSRTLTFTPVDTNSFVNVVIKHISFGESERIINEAYEYGKVDVCEYSYNTEYEETECEEK